MLELEQIVFDFLTGHRLAGRRLLLGFSGGADSTALFLALKRTGQDFLAVHFEHGIRGEESRGEAAWCRRFSEGQGVPFELHSLETPAHRLRGEGMEEAARRLRLAQWRRIVLREDSPVLLAHHLDDCLENLLLRLGRGAGCSGLSGLRESRELAGLAVYRPLLSVRRSRLEEYLRRLGIEDWRRDSSNADTAYRRNAVRHELLPLWRRIFQGDGNLRRSLEILAGEALYLEEQAARLVPGLRSLEAWRGVPPALLPRALRLWWRERTGRERVFSGSDLRRLRQALEDPAPGDGRRRRLELSGAVSVTLSEAGLEVFRETPAVRERAWRWRECPRLEMPEVGLALQATLETAAPSPEKPVPGGGERFGAAALDPVLQVRAWRNGDRIRPFGADFHRKLQDLWGEAGIPAGRRTSVPIVLDAGEIIWVPGVRRAEFARAAEGEPAVRLELLDTGHHPPGPGPGRRSRP